MISAPVPANEKERLLALLEYEVLDTPQEFAYDDITQLASVLCKTPIALVSLVDKDRQWFKSHHGLAADETPREVSFCAHAIHGKDLFIVPDAFADERFADNPLVTGAPVVRFYAGAPLINHQGLALGTLCVIDNQPRTLNEDQMKTLQTLARQVVSQLEQRRLNASLRFKFEELQQSTRQICDQQAMLVHSSKMAALGELSTGIAHEINNPLMIISGRLWKIQQSLESNTLKPQEALADIAAGEKALRRAESIIKGLSTFARNCENDPAETVSMRDMLTDFSAITSESLIAAKAKLEISGDTEFFVKCRPAQIIQVLLNLLNNSLYALKELESKWIKIQVSNSESMAKISFIDSGGGIPETARWKIMDPFFSTKPTGQGTGLGLSISKGLIESNDGVFEYDATLPNTAFTIQLPFAGKAL